MKKFYFKQISPYQWRIIQRVKSPTDRLGRWDRIIRTKPRPDRGHGDILTIYFKKFHVSAEYDLDGDLIFVYCPDVNYKDNDVWVKVVYLSKLYKRR